MPIKNDERDNITDAMVVFKLLAISGKAGKYMSMDNGPIAVRKPSMRMRCNLFSDLVVFIIQGKGIAIDLILLQGSENGLF
jgi:hypothetical protein